MDEKENNLNACFGVFESVIQKKQKIQLLVELPCICPCQHMVKSG